MPYFAQNSPIQFFGISSFFALQVKKERVGQVAMNQFSPDQKPFVGWISSLLPSGLASLADDSALGLEEWDCTYDQNKTALLPDWT